MSKGEKVTLEPPLIGVARYLVAPLARFDEIDQLVRGIKVESRTSGRYPAELHQIALPCSFHS